MADTTDNVVDMSAHKAKDPSIVGSLNEEEQQQVTFLSQRAQALTNQIGEISIRHSRLLGAFGEVEQQAQQTMMAAAKRLGVPDGRQFNILPSGEVQLVPIKAPAPQPQPVHKTEDAPTV